ncbi:PKD domain-containing protein [Candidatus Peregrinibacteria bacterium]|jgi:PKD repeat protein|nr:PKD domain-containing protein [Candidatus Peregrinibacteria bacterium]MBT7484707.1 PKD domain-containing protein [Candidatus Peregrinibacteria bacterium]MBT7703599.1 PKD domain-containing protein [Candidatus Peregrinibacteria bacterium]
MKLNPLLSARCKTGFIVGSTLIMVLGLSHSLLFASSYDPTASFSTSPSSGSIDTTFSFDASASYDQRGFSNYLDYRWNFDYGSTDFTDWSSSSSGSYEYDSEGDKTIALEVRDDDGFTDRTYGAVTVWETGGWTAWFDVSPEEGDTSSVFTFEADVSERGGSSDAEYEVRWDFDGDSEWDTDYENTLIAYHTYDDTGYYNPRMEIKSEDGEAVTIYGFEDHDPDSVTYLYVTFDNNPGASVNVYPSSGSTATTFYFDGSDSYYTDEFRWDLDGDGDYEYDWGSEENPTTKYDTPGTYEATLEVRDDEGNTDEAHVSVTISEDNHAPEAAFSVSSDSGLSDDSMGTTGTTFTFNASNSSDEEDSYYDLQVRWDFDGDDEWDTTYSTTRSASTSYSDAGTYTVILEVTDSEGLIDTSEETVTIVDNDAPIPDFEVSPTAGTPGTTFYFDASDSSDNQYQTYQLDVRWDWDGDGDYDTSFETDKTTSHQYEEAGTYTVTLQVRDPEGSTSETSETVLVETSTSPHARLSVDETSGDFSTAFHFDASDSYDSETEFDDLWFRWDFDYTGENDIIYDTSWSQAETKTKYFDQAGEIVVKVEVKDEEDQVSYDLTTVTLHWASEYLDYLKDNGIISGYSGGDLAPDREVTRAELLKMVMEATDVNKYGHSYEGYFSDVAATDWHYSYVEIAAQMGIANGYGDGTFRPNNSVNRAEAMKIILEAFAVDADSYDSGTFPDISSADWFADYVGTAHDYGLINGYEDGSFYPAHSMTRGQASKIIALAMQGGL